MPCGAGAGAGVSACRLQASSNRRERVLVVVEAARRGGSEEGVARVALAEEVVDLGDALEVELPAERRAAVEAERPERALAVAGVADVVLAHPARALGRGDVRPGRVVHQRVNVR